MRKLGPSIWSGRRPADVLLALLLAFAAGASCTTEEGITPECTSDLDKGYPDHNVPAGCNPFAVCYVNGPNGVTQANPTECCKDPMGMPLTGEVLQLCLYGYGAADPPIGSGATTTTASGGGMGGGGGAGGANGGGGSGG